MPSIDILNIDFYGGFEVHIYGSINLEKQYTPTTASTG